MSSNYISRLYIINAKRKILVVPLYFSMLSTVDPGLLTLIVMESYRNTSLTVYSVSDTRVQLVSRVFLVMRTSYKEESDGVHENITFPCINLVEICNFWPTNTKTLQWFVSKLHFLTNNDDFCKSLLLIQNFIKSFWLILFFTFLVLISLFGLVKTIYHLLYTGKSGSHDFHSISFSHENRAIIMWKSDEKFLVRISYEHIRLNNVQFSCEFFFHVFHATRYFCQIHIKFNRKHSFIQMLTY